VLGLLDVVTSVYRQDRDLFDGCRSAADHAVAPADRH
jgi:hypothetical protein